MQKNIPSPPGGGRLAPQSIQALATLLQSLPAMKPRGLRSWMVTSFISLSVISCGKGLPGEGGDTGSSIPVLGALQIGTQCGLEGSISQPSPQRLSLWECPLKMSEVEITQSPTPIILSADCQKKLITIRTLDRSTGTPTDVTWEVNPDNSFNFTMDGGVMRLKTDGAANTNCYTSLSMNMVGHLACSGDRDRVTINFDSNWYPGQGPAFASGRAPTGKACQLPASCRFYSNASLKQCQ